MLDLRILNDRPSVPVVSPLSHAREKCTHTVPLCVRDATMQRLEHPIIARQKL